MDSLICAHSLHWRQHLEELLRQHGYGNVRIVGSLEELPSELQRAVPELLLVMHEPGQLDGLRLLPELSGYRIPAILAVTTLDRALADQAVRAGYAAFLVVPSIAGAIHGAVALARGAAERLTPLRNTIEELERKLAERKVIERAKGLLMEKERLNEEQAFRKLRSLAMSRRIGMGALAEEIVNAATKTR